MRKKRFICVIVVAVLALFGAAVFFQRSGGSTLDETLSGDTEWRRKLKDSVTQIDTPRVTEERNRDLATLDPQRDGWESEAFSEAAQARVKSIVKLCTHPEEISEAALREFLSDEFSCVSLRPENLAEPFRDSSVTVSRLANLSDSGAKTRHRGARGFADALLALTRPFNGSRELHAKVKTVRSDLNVAFPTTQHRIEIGGHNPAGTVAQNATWFCEWIRPSDGLPKLRSVRLDDFEEVVSKAPHGTWFSDCTQAVVGNTAVFRNQLAFGLNHWLARIENISGMYIFAEYGLAVGDVNGDGLEDVYVCQPGGLPNRLLVQNADGSVEDRSRSAGVDWLDQTSSSLLVDLDNDGDQDLVIAIAHKVLLMSNNGQGRFESAADLALSDQHVQSLSAADYDNDGDLDIYVTVGFADRKTGTNDTPDERPSPFVYYDANEGGANVLFRNDGVATPDWQFTDVTRETGLDVHNRRHSLAAAWEDYDDDGDQDLYIANDYGQNCLYRNDAGRFVDVAPAVGVVDYGSGMSVSWSDYDRDGNVDLYIGNMFSSAGNRITRQEAFQRDSDQTVRSIFSRFAKGNTLFRNSGSGSFDEVSPEAAVEMGRWAWSSLFADLNNDGWEDLFVANGYITTEDTGDL